MSEQGAPAPGTTVAVSEPDADARAIVTSYHDGSARVEIGVDPEGPVGSRNFVTVTGDAYSLTRYFFFEGADREAIDEFAYRVIDDPDFRERSLDGRAEWNRVAQIYREASRRIETAFREAGLLTYRIGDSTAKRRHDEARDQLETLCQAVFREIETQVRSEQLITGLDAFVDERIERATEIAADIRSRDS